MYSSWCLSNPEVFSSSPQASSGAALEGLQKCPYCLEAEDDMEVRLQNLTPYGVAPKPLVEL
jgi:hypothetical protein